MAAVAHSKSFAKKVGVPQSVGKDFTAADKGRKFSSGGISMNPRARKKGGTINWEENESVPDWVPRESAKAMKEEGEARKRGRKAFSAQIKAENAKFVPSIPRKIKKYAGGGHVIGTVGKGGQRLSKANWNTWEAKDEEEKEEKSTAPSYGADEEAGEEAKENIARSARARRRGGDTQHTVANLLARATGSSTDADEEPSKEQTFKEAFAAAKGKNFTWKGKEYSGATKKSDSSAASPPKSHRTTGAGSKSYQAPKSTASTSSRFLANAEKDKKDAATAALKRNPKLSAPKDEPLQEVHPEDWIGVGKAVAGLGTAAYAAKKYGPSILKNMSKIESAVGKRANREARSEAFINETARKRAVARPLKQAQSSRKAAHAKYEADNKEAYRGMKRGGAVSRYCGGGMTKRYAAGGAVSSVSSRADGIASRGRTKCKIR